MHTKFYALNVGRGDAFVLEIPNGSGYKTVLIDGGDKAPSSGRTVLSFLQAQGFSKIDLLILTHLHPDHLGGLLAVAGELTIAEAVMPYPEFEVADFETSDPVAQQTLDAFADYQELFRLLKAQKTVLSLQHPFGVQRIWQFGNIGLLHLAPQSKQELSGFSFLEKLTETATLSLTAREKLLQNFDAHANLDCSIWLVEDRMTQTQLLILGGDAPLASWEQLLRRENLSPHGLKVSHHGMKDAVSERLIQQLSTKWLLISNSYDEYQAYHTAWSDLVKGTESRLFVTGANPATKCLVSNLPDYPVRML